MISGHHAFLARSHLMRSALHFGLAVATVLLLLLACRRSGERLGRLLEQAGVIERYVALLDPKVGMGLTLFVRVGLTGQDQETVEAFVEGVRKLPQVVECHLMAGDSDFLRPRGIPFAFKSSTWRVSMA